MNAELVVVPFERHVERELGARRRAIAWGRLLDRLAQAFLPDVRRATPEHTRLALADVASRLDHPSFVRARSLGAASWEHMVDALDDAILELRRADVDGRTLRAVADARPSLRGLARLLADAIDALDSRLRGAKGKLVDGRAIESLLADAIDAAAPAAVPVALEASELVVRAFVRFDPCVARLVRVIEGALEHEGGGVRIELGSFATRLDAMRERDPLEVLIDRAGALLGIPPETVPLSRRLGDFTGDGAPADPTAVSIAIAESASAQARAAVLAVMKALRAGTPIERIAVAANDEESLGAVRRLFDEASIPHYDARGPAPARAGIVAFTLDVLSVAARGFPRREVARLLRSTYVDAKKIAGGGKLRPRAVLAVLASALERTPTAHRGDAAATLVHTALVGLEDHEDVEELGAALRRIVSTLGETGVPRSRIEHVTAARVLIDALGLRVRALGLARGVLATDDVAAGVARAELGALAADSHAWEVFADALARYEAAARELALDRAVAPETFEHELRRALESGLPLPSGGRAFAVRIGRPSELAFDVLDEIVVLDANDGVFPRQGSSEGLLSAELAGALMEHDPRRAPPAESERAAAQLAELATVAASASHVTVAYRTEDAGGAALAPAAFVLWLERAGVTSSRWSDAPRAIRPVSPREHELLLLAIAPAYASRSPSAERRAEREIERERWHDRHAANHAAIASENAGALPAVDAIRLIIEQETGGGARPLSVTALERVATCPFQGFASSVLRAGEDRGPEDRPDAREEGTMVHDALRAVFEGAKELLRARPRDREAIQARAEAILAERFRDDRGPLHELAVRRLVEEVKRVLAVAIADDAWDFEAAELAFGVADVAPFVAEAEGARLSLRGTIDRVDVGKYAAAVRVIDYKRAVSASVRPDDLGTVRLQVPVYAARAREHFGVPGAEGRYLATQTPDAAESIDLAGKLAMLLADDAAELRRSLVGLIDPVRRGDVAPRPRAPTVCDRCDLHGGCRRPRFVTEEEEEP